MALGKVHAFKVKSKYPTIELSTTLCGKSGTQDRNSRSEYITMDGKDARFEISIYGEPVTCRRCLSLLRIRVSMLAVETRKDGIS